MARPKQKSGARLSNDKAYRNKKQLALGRWVLRGEEAETSKNVTDTLPLGQLFCKTNITDNLPLGQVFLNKSSLTPFHPDSF